MGFLRRQHDERRFQPVGRPVHRDLQLLHRFQQGRLGLGGGPVNLVGQHHLGHHRAGPELETSVALVVDGNAGDVGGEQVGGELDALELAAQRGGQALGQHRLTHARHVLHEDVALGYERRQGLLDYRRLADNHAGNVVNDGSRCGGSGFRLLHRNTLSGQELRSWRFHPTLTLSLRRRE